MKSVTAKCLQAAKISAILIDDGLELDRMHEIEWHKEFVPYVGRILRIEHVAEKILNEVRISIILYLCFSNFSLSNQGRSRWIKC